MIALEIPIRPSAKAEDVTYRVKEFGIAIRIPKRPAVDKSKIDLSPKHYTLFWARVAGYPLADGVCGSSSEEIFEKQRAKIEGAKSDRDARVAITGSEKNERVKLYDKNKIKIAYGVDDCIGDVEDPEEMVDHKVHYFAIFYRKGYRLELRLYSGSLHMKAKDLDKKVKSIAAGQDKERAGIDWKNFEEVVRTIAPAN